MTDTDSERLDDLRDELAALRDTCRAQAVRIRHLESWPDGVTIDGTAAGLIAGWRDRAILAEKKYAALLEEIALLRRRFEDLKDSLRG